VTITLSEKSIEAINTSFEKMAAAVKTVKITTPAWAKFTAPDWQKPVVDYTEIEPVLPPKVVEQTLAEEFVMHLQRIVHEVGPNHYCQFRYGAGMPTMKYVYQGQADCIVGRVLERMGVPLASLSRYEGEGAHAVVHALFNGKRDERQVARLARVANEAQVRNDSRSPWGTMLSIRA